MTSSAKKPYHHGDLRNALIEATLSLTREKGVAGFTMSDAARRAGVSVAAPYRHFADRNALVIAASVHGFDALAAELATVVETAGDDPVAVAAELAAGYVGFAEASPERFALMFSSGVDKAASADLASAVLGPRRVLETAVTDLRPGSAPAGDDATALWSIAHGVATLTVNGLLDQLRTAESSPANTARDLVRTWVAGIRGNSD